MKVKQLLTESKAMTLLQAFNLTREWLRTPSHYGDLYTSVVLADEHYENVKHNQIAVNVLIKPHDSPFKELAWVIVTDTPNPNDDERYLIYFSKKHLDDFLNKNRIMGTMHSDPAIKSKIDLKLDIVYGKWERI